MAREAIHITDVSPRDGLQNQAVAVSTADKLELVRRLVAAGVASVEATSFVSPKAVPQMADAAELLPLIHAALPALRVSALVPNLKGLERAHAAGAREVAVVLSATETMNRRNINMGLDEATDVSAQTLQQARAAGLATRAYVAVAFECPFEGAVPAERVFALAQRMAAAGAQEVVVADTIGAAAPAEVKARLATLLQALPGTTLAVHLHDTRGLGSALAWAALEAGVRRFDASVGGIGGCPFAPGASGNIVTEDLVFLLEAMGLRTGISIPRLLEVRRLVQEALPGEQLYGFVPDAGVPRGFVPATAAAA